VGAAGRIYVTARDGVTVALRHDRDNATLAVNRLEEIFSAPCETRKIARQRLECVRLVAAFAWSRVLRSVCKHLRKSGDKTHALQTLRADDRIAHESTFSGTPARH